MRSGGSSGEERIRLREHDFRLLLSPEEIAAGVRRVAAAIDRDELPRPLLLCVLKGAVPFCADLMRQVASPVTLDFVGVSSYGNTMTSGHSLTFTAHPGTELRGRNVIVVEDIVDSGRTLQALRRYLAERGAASVRVAALLHKPGERLEGPAPEYVGFDIEGGFVVGYGLDYAEEGRDLPGIFVLCDNDSVDASADASDSDTPSTAEPSATDRPEEPCP